MYSLCANKLPDHPTPYYIYDTALLNRTLEIINNEIKGFPFKIHFAIKACANAGVLKIIADTGFGADCVSGGEIKAAIKAGFKPQGIVYAGVGKSDSEIRDALHSGIGCFNVESVEELEIIQDIAANESEVATVALRVNPDIDAHTHHYITTGLKENKFGIDMSMLDNAIEKATAMTNIELTGFHFHIGSQITTMEPFVLLCEKINSLVAKYQSQGININQVNVGGGLGIDYEHPNENPFSPFADYFNTFKNNLDFNLIKTAHFELGRSVVAQCGSLISKVLYVKQGVNKKFIIIDAGMNDLIRPALYGAHHNIENLTNTDTTQVEKYDVVGPICESSDTFATDETLPITRRGDIIALRSAGAYGETMSSTYNLRVLTPSVLL
ncbi:MAG: diaminopimelate decarboxylase [Muribaculum sp.]|nr:diaminopimelate decarboxylase [Muribaculaceae bacterium]MCM1080654.1 diaminopimelate decarboxylase [Muribaculum sp.]